MTIPVLPITVGHQTISGQSGRMFGQLFMRAEKMYGRMRPAGVLRKMKALHAKKCGVTIKTVEKWIAHNDKALNTTTLL